MIYVYGLLAILATAIFIGGRYLFYRYGRNDERLKNAEGTNDAVKKSNTVKHDSTYDDELHNRYHK
jgi:hypothetical protein